MSLRKEDKIFYNENAESNFKKHVSQSNSIVSISVNFGLLLLRLLGKNLGRIPILKVFYRPTMSLISMHNLAAKNGLSFAREHEKNNLEYEDCYLNESSARVRDLVIIGSGPGGAIAARDANESNLDFLIIEKGKQIDKRIPSHSVEQMARHFRSGGQEVIISWPLITFAQGESWGGGSSINSGLYHGIPNQVADEWASALGISIQKLNSFQQKVESYLNVEKQVPENLGLYEDSPIIKMKENLGWNGGVIPRWRKYYNAVSYSHYGVAETLLEDVDREKIALEHEVDSIKVLDDNVQIKVVGKNCSHILFARNVCISAGVVSTPKILIRSKLAKPRDFHFQFHAMIKEIGRFPAKINNLIDIDPHQIWSDDLSMKIGAAVGTPELLTAIMESKGITGQSDFSNLCSLYVSVPSYGRNGLLSIAGNVIPFFVAGSTMRTSLRNAQETLRKSISAVGGELLGDESLSISTVHVFGSIPIGKSTLIDNRGYLNGTGNRVYIRDSSLLPTHPLVNPQGPLMQLLEALSASQKGDV